MNNLLDNSSSPALLILQDGTEFQGQALGASGFAIGEVVFNTSMTGYQEILTDPSYCQQIITMTTPHIGNVGCNEDDIESNAIHASGLIIRDYSVIPSNYRSQGSLNDYLMLHNTVAISDVDTRALTHHLRDNGAQPGVIITDLSQQTAAINALHAFPGLKGQDLAIKVTTQKAYEWAIGSWLTKKNLSATERHAVVYDFGVKHNILRLLIDRGYKLTVVPAQTSAQAILALHPDLIVLSNGPGDPSACDYAIDATQELMKHNIPMLGICLGFQILSLAMGAQSLKMKFGHHGANHPVKDIQTNRVYITSQNHGFAIDEKTLPNDCTVTHRSLFDNSLQGFKHNTLPIMGFQGHPEASPGPHDIAELITQALN